MSLPDAPWIRDAELNGLPEDPEVECPVCGSKTCDQKISGVRKPHSPGLQRCEP